VVRWEETITVDQPVTPTRGDAAASAVDALGVALRNLVDRVADRAMTELTTRVASAVQAGVQGAADPPPLVKLRSSPR
jgi:hypothetical protein